MSHPSRAHADFAAQLLRDRAGVAITEAALILPFFIAAGLYGVELANYSLTIMKVGQIAVQVADNASRIGDTSTLENRKIYEGDIDDLLEGARLQGGTRMNLFENGRVIVSSLETDAQQRPYIHWQRCLGTLQAASSYGLAGDVLTSGMGPAGREVSPATGDAVIFVEVRYTYQPLVSHELIGTPAISAIASFIVRANRDLSQIYQQDPGAPDPVRGCDLFTAG